MFINAFVISWRESLEALLVIGILFAWTNTQAASSALRRVIWAGVGAGIVLALGVAGLAFGAQQILSGDALDIFQIVLLFASWIMITQMVLWMHFHGRNMRQQLEVRATGATSAWSLAAVATLAVAREGIETVMFLFGAFVQAQGGELLTLLGGIAAGLALAILTAGISVKGARRIPLAIVFRVSEILLLLVAGAMLANGIDRILARDWLPQLAGMVWDSGAVLDDTQGMGRVLADFAGYRAQPSVLLLMAFPAFWFYVGWRLKRS